MERKKTPKSLTPLAHTVCWRPPPAQDCGYLVDLQGKWLKQRTGGSTVVILTTGPGACGATQGPSGSSGWIVNPDLPDMDLHRGYDKGESLTLYEHFGYCGVFTSISGTLINIQPWVAEFSTRFVTVPHNDGDSGTDSTDLTC